MVWLLVSSTNVEVFERICVGILRKVGAHKVRQNLSKLNSLGKYFEIVKIFKFPATLGCSHGFGYGNIYQKNLKCEKIREILQLL